MDYNSTSSSDGVGNGNGNGNSDGLVSPDYVSIVALVVSLIALLGTIAQVLQQYYASATGFSNCGESVMGDWHQSKRRIFRPTELRFEVQFEAPVLFVCPPANRRAPIRNAPILPISGSKESIKATRTPPSSEENENRNPVPPAQGNNVHTADNERATWVTLLSELQLMERDSQDWLQAQYGINTLNIPPYTQREAEYGGRTLVVALQVKRRSWDTMPAGVQKPYATTTMCHLLEIAAIMGIYWREFDRSRDRYRAEGNGYMLTGEKVADLGIVFTFQLCGKRRFKENRVIPVHEVKELCCGVVTTIFREGTDNSMLELLELLDDSRDLNWLQLGSRNEIAESLVLLGCNTATASYFRNEHKKHSHLFPVVFELVGMLGRALHIRNTGFRMVPNPTPYRWDKKFFLLRKLLTEFRIALQNDELTRQTDRVARLTNLAEGVERAMRGFAAADHELVLLETLHDALDECEGYLKEQVPREQLKLVLREHFNVVMRLLNSSSSSVSGRAARASDVDDGGEDEDGDGDDDDGDGRQQQQQRHARHFDELNSASPEERQVKFMEIYFAVILPAVKEKAVRAHRRRHSTRDSGVAGSVFCGAASMHSRDWSAGSVQSGGAVLQATATATGVDLADGYEAGLPWVPATLAHAESVPMVPLLRVSHQLEAAAAGGGLTARNPLRRHGTMGEAQGGGRAGAEERLDERASNIWCTLVFRMLCYLLLHDFDQKDVQIPKSELVGSRLPVYIT